MSYKEITIAVFLDISGAFSNTSINSLIRHLESTGVEKELLQWTAHLLAHRTTTATLGEENAEKRNTMGTMEGGIKSPVIWNVEISRCADKFPDNRLHRICGRRRFIS